MITIVNMIDFGTVPTTNQVWIVPGPTADHDDGGEFSGWYIVAYLKTRGVCTGSGLSHTEANELISSIEGKFRRAGMDVVVEVTCND